MKISKIKVTIIICIIAFLSIEYISSRIKKHYYNKIEINTDSLFLALNDKSDSIIVQKSIISTLEAKLEISNRLTDSIVIVNHTLLNQLKTRYKATVVYPVNIYYENDTFKIR